MRINRIDGKTKCDFSNITELLSLHKQKCIVVSWQKAESTIIITFSLFISHQEACLKIKVKLQGPVCGMVSFSLGQKGTLS